MTVALICVGWYLCGVLGCTLGTLSELTKGRDFTIGDLIGCVLIALGGLLTLIAGGVAYLTVLSKTGKVLIKGKK